LSSRTKTDGTGEKHGESQTPQAFAEAARRTPGGDGPAVVEWLNASPATVRRDISWLAARNLLTAPAAGPRTCCQKKRHFALSSETFQNNIQCYAARKRAIARHAVSMCADGETIIINGGTTTFMMAEFLADKQPQDPDQLLPDGRTPAGIERKRDHRPGRQDLPRTERHPVPFDNDITQHHYASKMFMSVYGLSLLGLMEADPLLIQAEKRLISQAEELVVLADSSKFAARPA
jgi:DeoR family ulaG and ulaABCDEF operon transcriptional repressor